MRLRRRKNFAAATDYKSLLNRVALSPCDCMLTAKFIALPVRNCILKPCLRLGKQKPKASESRKSCSRLACNLILFPASVSFFSLKYRFTKHRSFFIVTLRGSRFACFTFLYFSELLALRKTERSFFREILKFSSTGRKRAWRAGVEIVDVPLFIAFCCAGTCAITMSMYTWPKQVRMLTGDV